MNTLQLKHEQHGLARPCSAWDIFAVTGGLQCGNCLAHTVPPLLDRCSAVCADNKPCPLQHEAGSTLCWVHRMAGYTLTPTDQ